MIEIDNLESEELSIYRYRSEVQLYRYNEPEPGLFIAESAKIVFRALKQDYEPISLLIDRDDTNPEIKQLVKLLEGKVPIYSASNSVLRTITGFKLTRGVLCAMKRRPLKSIEEMCRGLNYIAVLDDVENPTNVGAIFRSAAALGVEGIVLTGSCSDPLYRRSIRVSMGTVFQIQWTFASSGYDYIAGLKSMDFEIIALALDERAVAIDDASLRNNRKRAIILGNEGYGLKTSVLEKCDHVAMIPMYNQVDSLNVAAASAVAFWELSK